MRVDIRDRDALQAVSPEGLAAYAKAAGWAKVESYGAHSDVYAAEQLPDIILPRTQILGDYASVVARLIEIFAEVSERDELALYRDLVTANRDFVRVQAGGSEDGSLSVNDGVDLIGGSRDLLLAAACSLGEPRPLYRAGANKDANDLLNRVRLGQTEHGSFVITLLIPIAPLPAPSQCPDADDDAPIERQLTIRLIEALTAARRATEITVTGDDATFAGAIEKGVSANLCEALDRLISPFPTLDVNVTWARTRPRKVAGSIVRFVNADAPILREAARSLRQRKLEPDARLVGPVHRLRRDEGDENGIVTIRAIVGGRSRSVKVYPKRTDYDLLTEAHKTKAHVAMTGDLEHADRLALRNARITSVIPETSE